MCSTLRFKQYSSKIGERVYVQIKGKDNGKRKVSKTWSGFARVDRLDFWKRKASYVKLKVIANVFQESKVHLRIPGGQIDAIGLKKDVYVQGKMIAGQQTVKLITRAPMNIFEASINDRWPCVNDPDRPGHYYVWDDEDVMKGQKELPF